MKALVLVLSFAVPAFAAAAQDPCAATPSAKGCVTTQAVTALRARTEHSAGIAHERSAAKANHPIVAAKQKKTPAPWADEIRSQEAHPTTHRSAN